MRSRAVASRRWALVVVACAASCLASAASAQALFDEVRSIATGPVPVERALQVATGGTLQVDVTDLATPAAAGAIRVAVTRGSTLVASRSSAGQVSFDAVAGASYAVRVLARAANAANGAAIGVRVTRASDPTPRPALLEFVATFAAAVPNPLQSQVDVPLTIPADGTYTFTLRDVAFPAPLSNLSGAVFRGSDLLAVLVPGTPTVLPNLVASGSGPTQYRVTVIAQAGAAARAGLYGLRVAGGPAAAVLYDESTPVGELDAPLAATIAAPGQLQLLVTDFAFPASLLRVGAAVTAGGTPVAVRLGSGSATAPVTAGPVRVWRVAEASTAGGAFLVSVGVGGQTVLAESRGVTAATGDVRTYSYPVTLPAAGTYRAAVTDFQFPGALSGLQFAVAQGGAILAQAAAAGQVEFAAAAGPATLLVVARPPAGGAGLFGAGVQSVATPPGVLLERVEAIGASFETRFVDVPAAGRYDFALADVAWPAAFQSLALAATRGGALVGRAFGTGAFVVDAVPGRYALTILATPAPAEGAGTFGLQVAPSAPTVALQSDAAQVPSGGSVRLTWTATSATGCTAGGAWSGARAATGSETVGPLTATSTFTLQCTGPGGTAAAQANVGVTAPPPQPSSGGGGTMGAPALLLLTALGMLRLRGNARDKKTARRR